MGHKVNSLLNDGYTYKWKVLCTSFVSPPKSLTFFAKTRRTLYSKLNEYIIQNGSCHLSIEKVDRDDLIIAQ